MDHLPKRGVTQEHQEFFDTGGRLIEAPPSDESASLVLNELGAASAEESEREAKDAIRAEIARQAIKRRTDELLERAQAAGKPLALNAAHNQARYEYSNGELDGYAPTLAQLLATNAGSYVLVARRVRELQAQGMCLLDAEVQARSESLVVMVSEKTDAEKERDYLGDSIQNLMRAAVDPGGGGGGSKGGLKRQATVKVDRQRFYDEILSDDGRITPISEEDRAQQELARCIARAERAGGGRPLDGDEPKMRVQGRVEPSKVVEMHQMTGMGVVPLAEEMHRLLKMVRNGAEGAAVLTELSHMLLATISTSDTEVA